MAGPIIPVPLQVDVSVDSAAPAAVAETMELSDEEDAVPVANALDSSDEITADESAIDGLDDDRLAAELESLELNLPSVPNHDLPQAEQAQTSEKEKRQATLA